MLSLPSPIQEIKHSLFVEKKLRVFIKREDLIHPEIGGNKWRKLKYNLQLAKDHGKDLLLTFGGAYSNHIYSVSSAAKYYGMESIGLIRGEKTFPLNPTLTFVQNKGMELVFIDRTTYRKKEEPEFIEALQDKYGANVYIIPEGGTNQLALEGCAEIMEELQTQLDFPPDYVIVPCGTGGTLAGLIKGGKDRYRFLGISVLRGNFLEEEIRGLLEEAGISDLGSWSVNSDFHFGGYAKFTPELIDFIHYFYRQYSLPSDPVYTGKMFFGVMEMIKADSFLRGSNLLIIHTGGLQGIAGFNERFSKYQLIFN